MGLKVAGFGMLVGALILSVSSTDCFADAASVQAVSRSLYAAEFSPLHPVGAPSIAPVIAPEAPGAVIPEGPAVTEPAAGDASERVTAAPGRVVAPPLAPVAAPVLVLEPSRTLSFDRLRREEYRFPEHGTVNRFAELATELPPLFGTDA